jgi:hypothetical protein
LDDLIEELRVDLQRFVEWGERIFACTATAGIREVVRSKAVFLATGFAGSYRRHWTLLSIGSYCE